MTTPTENSFRAEDDTDRGDVRLALAAAAGDRQALEALVRKRQRWVYAIAVRMMLNPADAADVTQEALLRVITRIGQFEGRSSFRTWAYPIVMNCFLDAKRGRLEAIVTGFDGYGEELDKIPFEDLEGQPSAERTLLVEGAVDGARCGRMGWQRAYAAHRGVQRPRARGSQADGRRMGAMPLAVRSTWRRQCGQPDERRASSTSAPSPGSPAGTRAGAGSGGALGRV